MKVYKQFFLILFIVFLVNNQVQNEDQELEVKDESEYKYKEYCLNEKSPGEVLDNGDQFIQTRKEVFTISLFSLRKNFTQTRFRINQVINKQSANYLDNKFINNSTNDKNESTNNSNYNYKNNKQFHNSPSPTFSQWVQILDANSKRETWNMAYNSQKKFSIQVMSGFHFLLQMSSLRVQVLYDRLGLYGAYVDYHICDIQHIVTQYAPQQVFRQLQPGHCFTLFNPYADILRQVIICFASTHVFEQAVAMFRLYKSRCYPNVNIIPHANYKIQQDFTNNQPIYQFSFLFQPYFDRIFTQNKVVTFFLNKHKIFYKTYQYLFVYDIEPIEILYSQIVSSKDNHYNCCRNVKLDHNQVDNNSNDNNKKEGEYGDYCVLIKKEGSDIEWRLCSYMEIHITKFVKVLTDYLKMYLLEQVEYPIMFSGEQNQMSINIAYDYLKALKSDVDYNSCRPKRKQSGEDEDDEEEEEEEEEDEDEDEDDDDEDDEDEEDEDERKAQKKRKKNNIDLKKSPQFSDDDKKIDYRFKYKVVKELEELEDFSSSILQGAHLQGDIFLYIRDKLKAICKEKKQYK